MRNTKFEDYFSWPWGWVILFGVLCLYGQDRITHDMAVSDVARRLHASPTSVSYRYNINLIPVTRSFHVGFASVLSQCHMSHVSPICVPSRFPVSPTWVFLILTSVSRQCQVPCLSQVISRQSHVCPTSGTCLSNVVPKSFSRQSDVGFTRYYAGLRHHTLLLWDIH